MLKLLGALLVICGSTAAGFYYSDKFKRRTQQLNEFLRCFYQLQNEIVYTHTNLPEGIKNLSKTSIFPIGRLFKEISELLEKNEVDTVFDAFTQGFKIERNEIFLAKEDIEIIMNFSKTLGESDIEGHKKIFSLVLENLKKQTQISETIMYKNVKMYRALGFTSGAALIILLL
jgi:stage III sporulation protein AB